MHAKAWFYYRPTQQKSHNSSACVHCMDRLVVFYKAHSNIFLQYRVLGNQVRGFSSVASRFFFKSYYLNVKVFSDLSSAGQF